MQDAPMDDNPTVLEPDDPPHVRAVARLILVADAGTAAALEKAELAKEDVPPTCQIDPDDEGVDDVAEEVDRGRVAPGAADAVLSRAQEDIGGAKEQPSGSNCTTHTLWWDGTCFLWCAAALLLVLPGRLFGARGLHHVEGLRLHAERRSVVPAEPPVGADAAARRGRVLPVPR